jgi:hypothetical protein
MFKTAQSNEANSPSPGSDDHRFFKGAGRPPLTLLSFPASRAHAVIASKNKLKVPCPLEQPATGITAAILGIAAEIQAVINN